MSHFFYILEATEATKTEPILPGRQMVYTPLKYHIPQKWGVPGPAPPGVPNSPVMTCGMWGINGDHRVATHQDFQKINEEALHGAPAKTFNHPQCSPFWFFLLT